MPREESAYRRRLGGVSQAYWDHLRAWGFTVTVAETGSEATGCARSADSPQLVLLDWVPPDIEGIELRERIRKAGLLWAYIYVSGRDPCIRVV